MTKRAAVLVQDLVHRAAERDPGATALSHDGATLDYATLSAAVAGFSRALLEAGLRPGDRVGVFVPKRFEALIAIFGAAGAGCTAVPINPILRAPQVRQIMEDCAPRALVTCSQRLDRIAGVLADAGTVESLYVLDGGAPFEVPGAVERPWPQPCDPGDAPTLGASPDDRAALLYTSGSTGMPKGVILSHRNLTCAAESVSTYLGHRPDDRLLALLPLSFDAGLSQVTSAFHSGCSVELMDYMVAQDVIRKACDARITGIVAVPPVWIPLADQHWPRTSRESLRYVASTGGTMPRSTVAKLRETLPSTDLVLMYGFTEAFRATWLDPRETDSHPDSIGTPIPHAELLVVRPDGTPCDADEPGELVQRGPLVSQGYWNDPERTAERFRPVSERPEDAVPTVWSGDLVRRDAKGFHYFIERRDEMIKTSGYRVSPTEVEAVVHETGLVEEVLALGVPEPVIGQAIAVFVVLNDGASLDENTLARACRPLMPAYMLPRIVRTCSELPKGVNGKPDRNAARALLGFPSTRPMAAGGD